MPEQAPPGEVVIHLSEEAVAVSKREVETGRVQVALTTEIEMVVARETLGGAGSRSSGCRSGGRWPKARPLPCRTSKATPS